MVQVYREALGNEAVRAGVFAGDRSPLIFGDPERWVAMLLEALKLSAAGKVEKSEELRAEALEAAPATSGRLNGEPFEWIADADTRIGPMLEAIVNGKYFWVPFDRIAELRMEDPVDLRDLVWMPAEIRWVNGGDAVALIPARYPASEASSDPQIQLARRTEWDHAGGDLYLGTGQRMLATDRGEYPLLEVRSIELSGATAGTTEASPDG